MVRDQRLPRVMAVHDLSGYGRCSLTVALPILSAMGTTCVCLPTAVLSTHTGGFRGYTFRDLTRDLRPMAAHWQREGIAFDAVYTGYLGSVEQLKIVSDIIDDIKGQDTLVVVDPVMGDEGRMYAGLEKGMVEGMRGLIRHADVFTPNLTEAALLLNRPYQDGHLNDDALLALLKALKALSGGSVVLTGVVTQENHIGAACYDGSTITRAVTSRVPARFDGTGDVFCSVLTGALLKGKTLKSAAQIAAGFTHDAIELTYAHGGDQHCGVDFERILCSLEMRLKEETL